MFIVHHPIYICFWFFFSLVIFCGKCRIERKWIFRGYLSEFHNRFKIYDLWLIPHDKGSPIIHEHEPFYFHRAEKHNVVYTDRSLLLGRIWTPSLCTCFLVNVLRHKQWPEYSFIVFLVIKTKQKNKFFVRNQYWTYIDRFVVTQQHKRIQIR